MAKAGIQADDAIMVGDNLNTDILGSSRVGMRNVWINREKNGPNGVVTPTYEVDSLTALLELVKEL